MVMGLEDVGRVRLGRDVFGREEIIGLVRDLKVFGVVSWGIRGVDKDEDEVIGELIVFVKGIGVGNIGRKVVWFRDVNMILKFKLF